MLNPKSPILVISDLQIPFEHRDALSFCKYLKRHYNISDENVLCVGDELDQLNASMYPKNPNVPLSAVSEIALSRDRLREWANVFPQMKLAISNHGIRWVKKATAAEIPETVLRSYQQIFETPPEWIWRNEWRFTSLKHPFRMVHGQGYSGKDGHRNAALDANISTIIGHLHSHAAVDYLELNGGKQMWAVNTGCMIDIEAYAFEYERLNRAKPILGVTVIFKEGKMPVFHPL